MKLSRLSLLAVLFLVPVARGDGLDPLDQWPHWRGPLANGTAPHGEPPLHWDAKTHIKWKVEIPGKGSATPVVWGDHVFVLTAVDTGKVAPPEARPKSDPRFEIKTTPPTTFHQFMVLCLDRQTGKVRWQDVATEAVPHEGHHPTHSYAAGSPVTDGQRLYLSFGSFGTFAYDLGGKRLWKRDFGRLHTRLAWGEATTPAVAGDTVVIKLDQEADSSLVALDAHTGATRWQVERDEKSSWSTPLLVPHKGRTQVITSATNFVRSYDLATGELLWQCGGQTVNVIPSPVVWQDQVICMSGYRGALAVSIPLDSHGDVSASSTIPWRHTRGTPYVPSPCLAGHRLYFVQANNPLVTCLDVRTGKPILDRERLPGTTSFYASPVAAGDRVYFVDRDGTTVVLRLADKLEVLATNKLDEPVDASPAIAGKQLFLRGEKHLYCIE